MAMAGAGGAVDFIAGLFREGRDDGPAAPSVSLLSIAPAVAARACGAGGDRAALLVADAGVGRGAAGRAGSDAGAGPPAVAGRDYLVQADGLETQPAFA